MPPSRLLRTGVALVAVAAALAGPAHASAADALDRARATGRLTPAEYALERARSLFSLAEVRGRWGAVERPDPHDATPILRDLRAALPHLRGRDRAAARGILARPSDRADDPFGDGYSPSAVVKRLCDAHVCVHWVETTRDAPPLEDLDASGIPDWVETTQGTFADVWEAEVDDLGYAPPLSDAESTTNGGDARLDVYLVDIGRSGYFGYCTTDDPTGWITTRVSAYCVLDDDFADPILQLPVPAVGLHVTAAHEFFHAAQFSYDWLEDLWFMEGTAVWIEDEVYDGANDLLRYLGGRSPLGRPDVPLDTGHSGYEYGAWLFWRYLSEHHGAGIVRSAWTRAVGDDAYSLRATRRRARGARLRPDDRVRRLRRREPHAALRVPRRPAVSAGRRDEDALPRPGEPRHRLARAARGAPRDQDGRTSAAQARGRKGAHRRGFGRTGRALGGGDARRRPNGRPDHAAARHTRRRGARTSVRRVRRLRAAGRRRAHERRLGLPLLARHRPLLPGRLARRQPALPRPRVALNDARGTRYAHRW